VKTFLHSPYVEARNSAVHRRRQGGAKGAMDPQISITYSHLCFVRRYPKQGSVMRLKIKHFRPPTNFWAGHASAAVPVVETFEIQSSESFGHSIRLQLLASQQSVLANHPASCWRTVSHC